MVMMMACNEFQFYTIFAGVSERRVVYKINTTLECANALHKVDCNGIQFLRKIKLLKIVNFAAIVNENSFQRAIDA
jgi:hypothetical protein